jgi:histidyl-tRNA synthetase
MPKKKKKPKKIKKQIFQAPKGMHDILPDDQPIWEKILNTVKDIAAFYNFLKIDTPILESADLFKRSVGETTDIIEKQMFSLKTKGGDYLVLRPEATASIARAYIEHGLSRLPQPLKLYYFGPMLRYEQPQAGRFRQFHQAGFEIISGENDPIYDIQVILVCYRIIESLKIKNITIQINSIGCKNCRPAYRQQLKNYYGKREKMLCKDCQRRLKLNPLRLLDCKNETCQEIKKDAPTIIDGLCRYCHDHFKTVLEFLEELSLPYTLNHYLVRGLDYYTKTVFEIFAEGFDFALASGGRYDYLVELLGGKSSPAVGMAIGIERLVEIIKNQNINLGIRLKPKMFLAHTGFIAKKKALQVIEILREAGVDVVENLGKESLATQLRVADKLNSPLTLILGQKEVFSEAVLVRDMKTGAQETIPINKLGEKVKKKLKLVN